MAVEYDPNGIPILSGESMLSDVPQYTQELAPKLTELDDKIDSSSGSSSIYVGQYVHNFGTVGAGDSGHNLTGFAFSGAVGDVWTANFSMDATGVPGVPNGSSGAKIRLQTAAGIPLYHPASSLTYEIGSLSSPASATYTWKATAASDYLVVYFINCTYGLENVQIVANGVINHGQLATSRRQMLKEELADRRADRRERNA